MKNSIAEISDVDARQILEPVMRPFVTMFDVMQQNAKAHKYAEKVCYVEYA